MKFSSSRAHFLLLAVLIFGVSTSFVFADNAQQFAEANGEYAAKYYEAATGQYDALVRARQRNAPLFYNLGNAWFRRGNAGLALLNYERALALEPHQPEATANLQFVREESHALQLPIDWLESHLQFVSLDALAWTAAVIFWMAVFLLVSATFSRPRGAFRFALALCAFLLCAAAAYALYSAEIGNHGRDLAIVTAKSVEARAASADNASAVLLLPAGSEVRVLSPRGDWTYAALPNNLRGWIPTRSIELVRL